MRKPWSGAEQPGSAVAPWRLVEDDTAALRPFSRIVAARENFNRYCMQSYPNQILAMDENALFIKRRIDRAGAHLKLSNLLYGLCWSAATCLGLWLALFWLDNLLNLPQGLRLPLALGALLFSGAALAGKVLFPAAQRPAPERTALMLEKQFAIPENLLINALQFQDQKLQPAEAPFAAHTITRSTYLVSHIRYAALWNWNQLAPWAMAAGLVSLLWAFYLLLFPRYFLNAGARYLKPLGDVPPPAAIVLKLTPAADAVVTQGDNLDLTLKVERPGAARLNGLPTILWRENVGYLQPLLNGGEPAPMMAQNDAKATFLYTFANVQVPFAFRVFAGDSYTRSVHVRVQPLPRIKDSLFRLTPPAYTGLPLTNSPGPPASIAALAGSQLHIAFSIEPAVSASAWNQAGNFVDLKKHRSRWEAATMISQDGVYEIKAIPHSHPSPLTIAQGDIRLLIDHAPQIDFIATNRNRFVPLGGMVPLVLEAKDDFGLSKIEICARPVEQDGPGQSLKTWTYPGPPGTPGPLREHWRLEIDPAHFLPDTAYLIEAVAGDFRPGASPGKSRPILLRVQSPAALEVAGDDPLASAFERLKQTIALQEKANHLTANLRTYSQEALEKGTAPQRLKTMTQQQQAARNSGRQALSEFKQSSDGIAGVAPLSVLVEDEMGGALQDISQVKPNKAGDWIIRLEAIEKRQDQIRLGLISLLGKLAEPRQPLAQPDSKLPDPADPPYVPASDSAHDLKDDLAQFTAVQERILERSKTLLDRGPQDLTEKEEKILDDLAREEAQWAKFFEEKLTDFSKLPAQDFADTSLATEFNEVFQEIKLASQSLWEKKVELAVPHEQSGLENAQELLHNLERWLPDIPDRTQWNMEEPLAPADIALAELPAELEDIVGELIYKEEEMSQDVEDVTSSWLDSLDKGAGWDAMDGPISSMSAKGVTGNLLPNQQEIGGRSGEGRTGRSHGQMVEETAEGKGGRETPTRLSPSPFESGSVKDSAKEGKGGATGGGKLAGFGEEGLRGPNPPAIGQRMPRLADQQARIRQEAETLSLKLRRYHLPTDELAGSINAMNRLEQAARKNDGLGVRRAYSRAIDALGSAKKDISRQVGLNRERTRLPAWVREQIKTGVPDRIPKGYEDMAREYFRALAQGRN